MFTKRLNLIGTALGTIGYLAVLASSAWAVSDVDTLERVISANHHTIKRVKTEIASSKDKQQISKLKNKLAILENDVQTQQHRLDLYSMRAGDWVNLSDLSKQKHIRDAKLPAEYADSLTFYIMDHPTDINVTLGALLADQARRYSRTQNN